MAGSFVGGYMTSGGNKHLPWCGSTATASRDSTFNNNMGFVSTDIGGGMSMGGVW